MNQVPFQPLHDRILVERTQIAPTQESLIYIPESAQEKEQHGIVLNIGSGKRDESGKITPLKVKIGDKVLFGAKAGTEIKVNDKNYLVMYEEEVLAVLKD